MLGPCLDFLRASLVRLFLVCLFLVCLSPAGLLNAYLSAEQGVSKQGVIRVSGALACALVFF